MSSVSALCFLLSPGLLVALSPDQVLDSFQREGEGEDASLSLLQLRASAAVEQEPVTCMGSLPGKAVQLECQLPFQEWFNGPTGAMATACIPSNRHAAIQFSSGSYCLTKDAHPEFKGSYQTAHHPKTDQLYIQCGPACPGYIDPQAVPDDLWGCPNGICGCYDGGAGHVYHSFHGHHFDWNGMGAYQYAESKSGDIVQTMKCHGMIEFPTRDNQVAPWGGEKNARKLDSPPFTRVRGNAYRIGGHDVVVMLDQWNTGKWYTPSFSAELHGVSFYTTRIDDRCFRFQIGSKGPVISGVDCASGASKPELDLAPAPGTDRPDLIDMAGDGSLKLVKGLSQAYQLQYAGEKAKLPGDGLEQFTDRWMLEAANGMRVSVIGVQAVYVEMAKSEVSNKGICANTHYPGFAGADPQNDPHDGRTVPLSDFIWNKAEARYMCEFVCGLPEDKENGYSLCDPPRREVPAEPRPEDACSSSKVPFEDAQTKCSAFKAVWLTDCLFDYCASGGDERFIVQEIVEEAMTEAIEEPEVATSAAPEPQVDCSVKLDLSRLVNSNLGQSGPDDGQANLRFSEVRPGVDMIVTSSDYDNVKGAPKTTTTNGFAVINMKRKSSPSLAFTFVNAGTSEPSLQTNVGITFVDLDQAKKPSKGYEGVTVCGADVVSASADTVLSQSRTSNDCDRFESSTAGTGKDNPRILNDMLSPAQRTRSASAYWSGVSSFIVTAEVTTGHPRPLILAGAPLECLP